MTDPVKTILLGGILLDRYLEVDHFPKVGQDTLIHRSFDLVGGCSLNVAVTLKNLGGRPYIVNKFGDDEIGSRIKQYVETLELPQDCMLLIPGGQTGYCLTVLDQTGERTFFTFRGCEIEYSPENIPSKLIADFSFVYVTGYYLLNPTTAKLVIDQIKQFHQKGSQILFDPGPLVNEIDQTQLRELMRVSDWFVPNSKELALIQQKIGVSENLVEWLFEQGITGVAVKKGGEGVDVFTPASNFTIKGFPVNPIDTNGAGDSFVGGFLYGLANKYPLRQAAMLANACGALTAKTKGSHTLFSLEDINLFISSFKDNNL